LCLIQIKAGGETLVDALPDDDRSHIFGHHGGPLFGGCSSGQQRSTPAYQSLVVGIMGAALTIGNRHALSAVCIWTVLDLDANRVLLDLWVSVQPG
jgi:hypothetical protein